TGLVLLTLLTTPDAGSSIQFAYERAGFDVDVALTASPDSGGIISGTVSGAPLKPGSVQMRWQSQRKAIIPSDNNAAVGYSSTVLVDHEATDDGGGNWIGHVGSINYTTGAFSLRVEQTYDYHEHEVRYELIEV